MKNNEKMWQGVERMSLAKNKRRRELARLPFEKKISILLRLQNVAREMSQISERKRRDVWEISGKDKSKAKKYQVKQLVAIIEDNNLMEG